uniref:Uncharacterized protein n=1 Tax=Ixodes ricinus TaxID=34613 RepID=A0A6B0UG82_IXORI
MALHLWSPVSRKYVRRTPLLCIPWMLSFCISFAMCWRTLSVVLMVNGSRTTTCLCLAGSWDRTSDFSLRIMMLFSKSSWSSCMFDEPE